MRKLLLLIFLVAVGIGVFRLYPQYQEQLRELVQSSQDIAINTTTTLEENTEELPAAARPQTKTEQSIRLSPLEVIRLTNSERAKSKLPALTYNSKLSAAAQIKVQDMFQKQYFEHVSPDGKGPSYIIGKAGYTYIVVGENLAVGNFKDNASLVKAWMDSPGHRANILNNRFTEIGVAVGEGTYKGKKTWFAVQEFGLPASACPAVDTTLKRRIDDDTVRADTISAELIELQQKVRTMPRSTSDEEAAYRSQVEYYNRLVTRYNKLISDIKAHVEEYNKAVRVYNSCIES